MKRLASRLRSRDSCAVSGQQAGEIRDEVRLTVQVGVFLHLCHINWHVATSSKNSSHDDVTKPAAILSSCVCVYTFVLPMLWGHKSAGHFVGTQLLFGGQRTNPPLEALNISWCKVLWSAASRTECSCTAAEALLRYQGHTGGMKTDERGQGRIIMRSSLLALVCVCTLCLSLSILCYLSASLHHWASC